jgi:hypothetical protein
MKVTEAIIEKQILRALNLLPGVFAWKSMDQKAYRDGIYQKGSSYQIRGVSDIICLKDSKAYFLEVKTHQGKQSQYQMTFEKKVKETGNNYAVVRSVDDALKAIDHNPITDIMR